MSRPKSDDTVEFDLDERGSEFLNKVASQMDGETFISAAMVLIIEGSPGKETRLHAFTPEFAADHIGALGSLEYLKQIVSSKSHRKDLN